MTTNNITKENIQELEDIIRKLYLVDDIPWVIGYSGGKDSTATLQLVWYAISKLPLEKRTKTIHIINTDTLVESPIVSRWAKNALGKMEHASKVSALPFTTHVLSPEYNQTFWVNFIGRGYPVPRRQLRWCTDRLKIQPVNNFIKNRIAEHGEIIMILGTRKAESVNRARSMEALAKKRVRDLLSPNPTLANELVFSPLENWSDDDVWAYLLQYTNPWNLPNTELLTLYRGATADNECPIIQDKSVPSCGKSRFGCWVCTVVSKDKSMEAMISNNQEDNSWLKKFLNFRDEFGNLENDRERRSFRKRSGALQGGMGRLNHGPYKKEWREIWLRKLLELQLYVQEQAPKEYRNYEIITLPELREIRRIWVKENHEFDDSLPKIYKEVFKVDFDDPEWIPVSNYNKKEWDLLKSVCEEVAPEEELAFEMMYSLIDQEMESRNLNKRSGILKNLEKIIKRNFYQNEEDATQFYTQKMSRKKELGGKYNEHFFEGTNDDFPEEEADE
ncbi:DNA phosphorothioation system sulfurtransferase DndC [Dubosiella newyorkensis]|uniref:Sulfurtransferase DndC n=1 Tax=Dubosiella newyorkensis TaxID=1862672 RepID=A0A1U7NPG8_9FIRM|nr:DNA phosphorothioation system sulfurtransferase DndC [Dubosiella newyorkensis]OLU47533.1 sulfurtransferase DndC [Dubosiella newyorkensis]